MNAFKKKLINEMNAVKIMIIIIVKKNTVYS